MNGDTKKKILSEEEVKLKFGMTGDYGTALSEKNLVEGTKEVPLGTRLSDKIVEFKLDLEFMDSRNPCEVEEFESILNDMFLLMHHHRYGVLYNVLKKFR